MGLERKRERTSSNHHINLAEITIKGHKSHPLSNLTNSQLRAINENNKKRYSHTHTHNRYTISSQLSTQKTKKNVIQLCKVQTSSYSAQSTAQQKGSNRESKQRSINHFYLAHLKWASICGQFSKKADRCQSEKSGNQYRKRGGPHRNIKRERERERERMELQIDRVHAKREGLATHYHESRV